MGRKGLFIDYEYCTGCHTCEVACQVEHHYPLDQWGIRVAEVGPWQYGDRPKDWQWAFIPVPTDQCDLCAERTAKGKEPTCVKHCQASIIKYGDIEELVKDMEDKTKTMTYCLK